MPSADEGHSSSSAVGTDGGAIRQALKWIATISAVISFVFAVRQALNLAADTRARSHQIAELEKVAASEEDQAAYEAAWSNLIKAQQLAEAGGAISKLIGRQDRDTAQVDRLLENLAMKWMEDVRLKPGQKFAEVVDRIEPVLQQGAADATGSRKADLLAHLGWGAFLRQRDGFYGNDPERLYKKALAEDPHNPYALANSAFFALWTSADNMAAAEKQFDAALAVAGAARPYVRRIQFAALQNHIPASGSCEIGYLRQVNAMRQQGEPVDDHVKQQLYSLYESLFWDNDPAEIKDWFAAVPPAEQVKMFQALYMAPGFGGDENAKRAYLALLEEAAGQDADAKLIFADLRVKMTPEAYTRLVARPERTIKKISSVPAAR